METKEKLNEFLNYADQIIKKFEGENEFPLHINYLIENVIRTYDILRAIEILNNSFLNRNELEHPIGILLRSGLYDFIYFQYVSNKSVTNNLLDAEKFEIEVREYMNGHFNKIDPNLELDESLSNMDRFKDFGNKKEFKVLGILKQGRDFAVQKKLNYLEQAIDLWEWYSKYEHHGVFTNPMYNLTEDNEYRFLVSLHLLLCNINLSLATLIDLKANFIKPDELSGMREIILNFIPFKKV